MKKTIEVKKHPYMWKVEVTFGTLQEMIANACNSITARQLKIGGSFNKGMEQPKRAALINVGVNLRFSPDRYFPKAEEISEVKGIFISPWEAVYWFVDVFDEELKQGLYPVKADWDGNTYIERWTIKGKDKNGVPICGERYYELTDTYRY